MYTKNMEVTMAKAMRNKTNCYCVNLRRTASIVTNIYDKYLEPANVTLTQYCILSNLEKMDGCSVSALADSIGLERTTLVRTLKPLTVRGFVSDISEPGTRSRKMHLTKKGKDIVVQAKPLWLQAQTEVEKKLGKENADFLLQLPERL